MFRISNSACTLALGLAGLMAAPSALAQTTSTNDDVNKSNNPLAPSIALNVQDYYVPSLEGAPGAQANVGIVRALTPFELGGYAHLLRTQLQVPGVPAADGGIESGVGDLTVFDVVILQEHPFAWGAGPLVVAPTAEDRRFGAGRWQAGFAAGFAAPQDWGVFGALLTYAHSVGSSHRADVENLTVQPFLFFNLPNSFYIQSAGIWQFDLENDRHYMPVGLGLGRHWQVSRLVSFNTFIEPEYTVGDHSAGTPDWTVFAGISFQYSLVDVIAQRGDRH